MATGTSPGGWAWEATAVALAIAYLVLAIRQNRWCWPAAIASSAIYVLLMLRARLYLESALQVFYVAAAAYGWWCWRPTMTTTTAATAVGPPVTTWPWRRHLVAIAVIFTASAVSAMLLGRYTQAALPILDSLTSFGSLFATWLVARKILENWIYWFVIDGVSVYIYLARGLVPTAGLYLLYLVMIVIGYRDWRRSLQAQSP